MIPRLLAWLRRKPAPAARPTLHVVGGTTYRTPRPLTKRLPVERFLFKV